MKPQPTYIGKNTKEELIKEFKKDLNIIKTTFENHTSIRGYKKLEFYIKEYENVLLEWYNRFQKKKGIK